MAFVRAGAGQFRAQTLNLECAPGPLLHKPPSGQHAPPLSNLARFPGSLVTLPGKRKPFLPAEDFTFSPGHTSQQFSLPPHRQSAQGGPGDLGPGLGPATVMRQVKRARAGGPQDHGRVLQGGLRPAPRLGP